MSLKSIISIVGLTLAAVPQFSEATTYTGISDRFKTEFHKQLKANNVPGGAFVIVKDDKIIKLSTYGKRKKGGDLNVNADTVFRLASVSKTFAGTLATMLVQEGKFSWEEPVNKYVPDFTLAGPTAGKDINLGHVIGQSTGLMPNSYDNIINANGKLEKIIPKFSKLTPMCTPGKCYSYQNIAFSLIQEPIEETTGKSYETLINERIFTPLKMTSASLGIDNFLTTKNRAEPHVKTKSGFRQVTVKPNYYQLAPAAGVNASISDISKWLMANMGNRPDVLSPILLSDITEPGVRTRKELRRRDWREHLNNAHYGKGWRVYDFNGKELIYHAGWVAGYVAEVAYSPELNVGMAILLNGESRVIAELGSQFWSDVFEQYEKSHKG
ncbi:beta-lactamase family protein [Shewanella sp. Scap07]|uniref:serine hydrolase domain-containing protein n=1 Tax=Shewanella sp. Scap07 TaxID=2589987 RepID=UPI0015B8012E|nr:serine hydrolase domain-containing protein [Shewanella sp. Scap07]QLE85555.1 beta-lactamase family protein [Shewanella sp. Scap07]